MAHIELVLEKPLGQAGHAYASSQTWEVGSTGSKPCFAFDCAELVEWAAFGPMFLQGRSTRPGFQFKHSVQNPLLDEQEER